VKRFNLFFTASMMVVVANLLLANDTITIWDGAETQHILQSTDPVPFLPAWVLSFWSPEEHLWLFWWRLPSAVLIILAMVAFYFGAKKLLGQRYSQFTLLVLGASFFIVPTGKLASTDSWAFAGQWLSWLLMLLYLKQEERKWQLFFYLVLGLTVWIQPIETILFVSLNTLALYFFHPQKNKLIRLNPIAALAGSALLFHLTTGLDWQGSTAYWSIGQSSYLKFAGWSLLAWLPFLGFLISAIREMINKWKRKEELTIILVCGLLSALVSHAIVFHGILAIVVGRQLSLYFDDRFPYRPFVKTGAILHLVIAFTAAVILTIYCFLEFRGVGFRSALALTTIYWMPSFMAVIGLYGMNKRYVYVGTIWAGLLATFLFYVQMNPLIESRRRVVENAFELLKQEKNTASAPLMLLNTGMTGAPKEKVYSLYFLEEEAIQADSVVEKTGLTLSRKDIGSVELAQDTSGMAGWDDRLSPVLYEIK